MLAYTAYTGHSHLSVRHISDMCRDLVGILWNSIRILGSDSQEARVYRVCTEATSIEVTRLEVISHINHISRSFYMSKSLVSKRSLRSGQ